MESWGHLLVLALAAIGIGLFLFNMRMASTGYRDMRKLEASKRDFDAQMATIRPLTERFKELKAEFDILAADMEDEERSRLWSEVDEKNREVAEILLLGSLGKAIPLMEETVALAESVVASLKSDHSEQ